MKELEVLIDKLWMGVDTQTQELKPILKEILRRIKELEALNKGE